MNCRDFERVLGCFLINQITMPLRKLPYLQYIPNIGIILESGLSKDIHLFDEVR